MSEAFDPAALQQLAFWNRRYEAADYAYGTAPNEFLARCRPFIAPAAQVLCLADGEGRNGVWLAEQGCTVTSVDLADAGLAKAQRLAAERGVTITTQHADVTTLDLGRDAWDAIVSIFLHLPAPARRALHQRCLQALRPGGVIVFQAYTPEQLPLGTGGPKEVELLVTLAEVEADFAGCAVEYRHSGLRHIREGALHSGDSQVAQLVVRKP